jgi:hypothetical protein
MKNCLCKSNVDSRNLKLLWFNTGASGENDYRVLAARKKVMPHLCGAALLFNYLIGA